MIVDRPRLDGAGYSVWAAEFQAALAWHAVCPHLRVKLANLKPSEHFF